MLKERFGLEAFFSDPIIIHKETPIDIGKGACFFDRVSQVEFQIQPLPLGSGLQYESKASTDYLFPKYQKQISTQLAAQQGVAAIGLVEPGAQPANLGGIPACARALGGQVGGEAQAQRGLLVPGPALRDGGCSRRLAPPRLGRSLAPLPH